MSAEQAAWDELARLTSAPGGPRTAWRWSIPAKPDRDSDLILAAGLQAVRDERDALRAKLARIAAIQVVRREPNALGWVSAEALSEVLEDGL